MSVEGNYILNVLFLHSAPRGENPSATPADCMEKSCFLKPSNVAIYMDIKTGRAVRDLRHGKLASGNAARDAFLVK